MAQNDEDKTLCMTTSDLLTMNNQAAAALNEKLLFLMV